MANDTLLSDLTAWSEDTRNFHEDRQLSDRILIATGWRCIPDPGHPAKVRWEFGKNPTVSCWEPYVPHPINSIDDAIGQVPFRWLVVSMARMTDGMPWSVIVRDNAESVLGQHISLSVAVSIAAVRAWRARKVNIDG
jgi:hypothetical protein